MQKILRTSFVFEAHSTLDTLIYNNSTPLFIIYLLCTGNKYRRHNLNTIVLFCVLTSVTAVDQKASKIIIINRTFT